MKAKAFKFFSNSRFLASVSGAVTFLAIPPLNLYFFAWFGLIPLFYALEKPLKSGFGEGFCAGLVFNTATVFWLAFNSGTYPVVAALTMFVTALVLATGWGVASWVYNHLQSLLGESSCLIIPFSWIAWEGWLSYLGELAFPWPLLSLTQAGFSSILQIMEFTGVWGVSFWVVSLNVILFLFLKRINQRRVLTVVLFFWFLIPFGARLYAGKYIQADIPFVNVMIIQGNIDPKEKWERSVEFSWTVYDSITRTGSIGENHLILWPETALPINLPDNRYYCNKVTDLAENMQSSIVLGASGRQIIDERTRPINAAYQVKPQKGLIALNAKWWLVPFGERVPFQFIIPQLRELNLGQAEFLTGVHQKLFEVKASGDTAKFPVIICYESVFSDLTRQAVRNGANLHTNISNDAWYGRTTQLPQIAAISRFRCIETRRSMARASNTGISFLADPLGRIMKVLEIEERGSISGNLPLNTEKTFFVKYGRWFLGLMSLVYGIVIIVSLLLRRKG
ncbi:apolipoprotein N-acyltransferase [bacterium]|nr:apolipoprotein N-acyltransferase [bacterium]